MILQVGHSEPVVRHAITALGAQHEENSLRRLAPDNDLRTSFPLQQYSKALNELQRLIDAEDVSINLVLICSLLFIHFEALRQSFLPAIVHAESAIRLLHERKLQSRNGIDSRLLQAMMRIDIQGAMYLGMRTPGLPYYAADSELPLAFRDLTQARDVVNTWTCRL